MVICSRCGTAEGVTNDMSAGLCTGWYSRPSWKNRSDLDLCKDCQRTIADAIAQAVAPINSGGPVRVIERVVMPPTKVGWFNWLVTLLSAAAGGLSLWMTLKK